MGPSAQPLVSVVTPVYNGEKHLEECIASVLAQTYNNWEYVIVNNCSTDRSLEIAQTYADEDERIRIHNNSTFLSLIRNWNHALKQISPESKYCKVLHADDWLLPECLERMVIVSEEFPSVGIVSSFVLRGTKVTSSGIQYPNTIVSGKEICRSRLLGGPYVFGSPTSLLIRANLIVSRDQFYDESYFHADVESCFNILQHSDFGFVHQVLSYTRLHDESQTSTFASIRGSDQIEKLRMLLHYGPIYFNENEYLELLSLRFDKYYRFLARNFLRFIKKEIRRYHKEILKEVGYPFSLGRFTRAFISELCDKSLRRLKRQFMKETMT